MSKHISMISLLIAALLLSACGSSTQPAPTIDATELASVVYSTQTAMAAANTVTAIAGESTDAPAFTQTPVPSDAAMPQPSLTPTTTPQPAPTNTLTPITENCTNKAQFVEETIPDGSTFAGKETFVKTWVLKNTGTCTWTSGYSLVFAGGEAMGAPDSLPLTQIVNANESVNISIDLTTPAAPGNYQGDWKLRSSAGNLFGVGKQADEAFWVQIKVVASVSDLNLGSPTQTERFDSDNKNWFLQADDNLRYEIKDGSLWMTALNPVGDQWRVHARTQVTDLFLQADFKTGDTCSGKDGYGLIIRTSAKANAIYNNGYIFTISCDGMYRLYQLDTGSYVSLINWTSSADLRNGPNQENRLGIWAKGGKISLYINGKKVADIEDATHTSGQYGLVVRAEGETDFAAAVKEINYWELK